MLNPRMAAATLIAVGVLAFGTSAAEPELPKTLEEQIKYLEGALGEAVRTNDLPMLEMVVNGYKATKLEGKDLELSILRGELSAVRHNNNGQQYYAPNSVASLEAWGLMARAKLGNADALATLRKLGDENPTAPAPLPTTRNIKPADYQALQAAHNAYNETIRLRDQALFVLALMKEPGIQDKAFALIQNRSANTESQARFMGMNTGGDPVTLAVLEPDIDAGFKRLLEYCQNDKNGVKNQLAVLGELNGLMWRMNAMGADEQFSVVGAIRAKLPKDGRQQLLAPFLSILKRYEPDPKNPWDSSLNQINNIIMSQPGKTLSAESLDVIEAFVKKLPGANESYPKQGLLDFLKRNGRGTNTAVKPPKPPAENTPF